MPARGGAVPDAATALEADVAFEVAVNRVTPNLRGEVARGKDLGRVVAPSARMAGTVFVMSEVRLTFGP
jgi:hypothetical protein